MREDVAAVAAAAEVLARVVRHRFADGLDDAETQARLRGALADRARELEGGHDGRGRGRVILDRRDRGREGLVVGERAARGRGLELDQSGPEGAEQLVDVGDLLRLHRRDRGHQADHGRRGVVRREARDVRGDHGEDAEGHRGARHALDVGGARRPRREGVAERPQLGDLGRDERVVREVLDELDRRRPDGRVVGVRADRVDDRVQAAAAAHGLRAGLGRADDERREEVERLLQEFGVVWMRLEVREDDRRDARGDEALDGGRRLAEGDERARARDLRRHVVRLARHRRDDRVEGGVQPGREQARGARLGAVALFKERL